MSSTATFKPAMRRGGTNTTSNKTTKIQTSSQVNQGGSIAGHSAQTGGGAYLGLAQSPNIRKNEFNIQRANTIHSVAQSRPSLVSQGGSQQFQQALKYSDHNQTSSREFLTTIDAVHQNSQSQSRRTTVGFTYGAGKEVSHTTTKQRGHQQKVLSIAAPVTPSNHNQQIQQTNLNDYYSVQSSSNNNINNTSRNISACGSNTGTALKKSSIHGGSRSNRKTSHVSASRNNNAGHPAYSMIKSSNQQPSSRVTGMSGRMQKQFHQYHGLGGGSPPLKGSQRTSMMNLGTGMLGSTQDNSNIMQLVPIINNKKNDSTNLTISSKRPYEQQRSSNLSMSQERSRPRLNKKASKHNNNISASKHFPESTFLIEHTTDIRQQLNQIMPSNGVTRTSMGGGVFSPTENVNTHQKPRNSQLKTNQYCNEEERPEPENEDRKRTDSSCENAAIENSNFLKEYHPTNQHLTLPRSSPRIVQKETSSPRNLIYSHQKVSNNLMPAYIPSKNTLQSAFFKSPINTQKKHHYQVAKSTTADGSPAPPVGRQGNTNQAAAKTILNSRLSIGGGTMSNKKTFSINNDQSQKEFKNKNMQSASKKNLNIDNTQYTGQQAASLLQIDLSQLSTKNGMINHAQTLGFPISMTQDEEQPFLLYGGKAQPTTSAPALVSQTSIRESELRNDNQNQTVPSPVPGLKKRESLTNTGNAISITQSKTSLTPHLNPLLTQVTSFQQNLSLPPTVIFGKSPKASSSRGGIAMNHLNAVSTSHLIPNRHSIVNKYTAISSLTKSSTKKEPAITNGNSAGVKKSGVTSSTVSTQQQQQYGEMTGMGNNASNQQANKSKTQRMNAQIQNRMKHQSINKVNNAGSQQLLRTENKSMSEIKCPPQGDISNQQELKTNSFLNNSSQNEGQENSYQDLKIIDSQTPDLIYHQSEELFPLISQQAFDLEVLRMINANSNKNEINTYLQSENNQQVHPIQPPQNTEQDTDSDHLPMTKKRFLTLYSDFLTLEQVSEIDSHLSQDYDMIHFIGPSLQKALDSRQLRDLSSPEETKYDDEEGYYLVKEGEHLLYRYEVLKILGKGSFAQVVACKDHKLSTESNEVQVAVKITRNTELDHKFALGEAKLLQYLMENDPKDENNIVRLYQEFSFREHHCFVFELLESGDLFEHLKSSGFSGFQVSIIKSYTREILKALVFLEKHKIIHCDLKPENILLVQDKNSKNHKLKIVDFGSGSFRGEQAYTYVQSRFYRAPEVIMRLLPPPTSYTEKVDIWSLGCIIAELFTGEPLFPGNNEQEQLELIMEICGIPPASLIDRTRKKEHYFDTDYSPFLIEDEEQGILRIPDSKKLESIILTDDHSFIDFIMQCLILDPEKRMSASQALQHPWILDSLSRSPRILQLKHKRASSDFYSPLIQPESSELNGLQKQLSASISSTHQAFLAATSSMRMREEDAVRQPDSSPNVQIHSNMTPVSNFENLIQLQMMITSSSNNNSAKKKALTMIDLREDNSQTSSLKDEGTNQNSNIIQLKATFTPSRNQDYQEHIEEEIKRINDDLDDTKADQLQIEMKQVANNKNNQMMTAMMSPVKKGNALNASIEKRRDREARKAAAQAANAVMESLTPLKGSLIVTQSPLPKTYHTQMQGQSVQVIGHYEIFREEDKDKQQQLQKQMTVQSPLNSQKSNQLQGLNNLPTYNSNVNPGGGSQKSQRSMVRESTQSVTSGIASEANIPHLQQNRNIEGIVSQEFVVNPKPQLKLSQKDASPSLTSSKNLSLRKQSDAAYSTQSNAPPVTTENSINKITITFYQKRNQQQQQQLMQTMGRGGGAKQR